MSYIHHTTSVEVLRVQEDDLGPYAKVRVLCAGEEIVIRWGLDPFTYHQLKTLVFTQMLDQSASADYKCYLSLDRTTKRSGQNTVWVVSRLGTQSSRHPFQCSDLFVGNLTWLQNIGSVEELRNLAWDGWITHQNHQQILNLVSHAVSEHDHVPTKRRNASVALSIAAILCIAAVLVWYCVWRSEPVHTTVPLTSAPKTHNPAVHRTLDKPASHSTAVSTQRAPSVPVSVKVSPAANPSAPTSTDIAPVHCTEVYQVPAGDVALTIDDGPTLYTAKILEVLAEYGVHATFFFIGDNVRRFPEVTKEAAEQGNEVGDHSVDHHDLSKMSLADQEHEILDAASQIEQITNQPVSLFRPPYDSFNNVTKEILNRNHFYMALYNDDPKDWQATSPEQVERQVLSQSASGKVIDLHDRKDTMLALPKIIESFQAQHLHFVLLPSPTSSFTDPDDGGPDSELNNTGSVTASRSGSSTHMRRY